MMNIKLVAVDMDGTLLDSKKRLPEDFIPWVKSHPQVKVAIASGRQYYTLERMFHEIADRLVFIAENGTLCFYRGEIIYKNVLKKEDVVNTLRLLEHVPYATPLLCGIKGGYMQSTQEEELANATQYYARLNHEDDLTKVALEENIVKFAIYFKKQMAEASAHYFDDLPKHLAAVVSDVSWIDVANCDANKGAALKSIQQQYHISQEESMAFGDYFNDVEMLQQCKYSYAMENAHPEVKKKANFLTSSNDDDGVMKILRTI